MDAATHRKMTDFAQRVIDLPPKEQDQFFRYLVKTGILSQEESDGLKLYVATAHLFLDARYYETVKAAVGERIVSELYDSPANSPAP